MLREVQQIIFRMIPQLLCAVNYSKVHSFKNKDFKGVY